MLVRTAIFAAMAAILATQIPSLIGHMNDPPSQDAAPNARAPSPTQPATTPQMAAVTPGSTVLDGDGRGHFIGTFKFNGKPVTGLVDTGASLIAINESTARRLGFSANKLDFRHTAQTANGETEAAHVVLDRVEIGSIRVRDVDAFVLRDKALNGTLVGVSFLSKLKSYQVKGNSLTLAN